jgi:NDP-sugar pyrophosphorylase family protein
MINILIPIAGKSNFFGETEYKYPKPLIEIGGNPMIQLVIENLEKIKGDKRYIFVVNSIDCSKHHLDNTLFLLTDNKCEIIRLEGETSGAACSCLMAIDYINNEDPLIIVNGDQIIDTDLNQVIHAFSSKNADVGVISFDSVHPKWSYIRLDDNDRIIETAEKRPLSRHAIAGFYYYSKGEDFVRSAMSSIRKDANVEGLYFIAPTINELVLEDKVIIHHAIANDNYHNFYSPQRIAEFESKLSK